jgi:hypothetical protein
MSSQRKFGGTGLGLVISKSLAKLLDGNIYYTPREVGNGSIFTFEVSLEVLDKTTYISKSKPLTSLKTLIVDDTKIGREVIHAIIHS